MTTLVVFLGFLFGAIIGSFLNVVVLRYNTGVSMGGRSACPMCGKTLTAFELVPVLSYIALRGKCLSCKSRISPQYLLVELISGVLFAFWAYQFFADGVFIAPVIFGACTIGLAVALLLIIAVYDVRHMIIPDGIVYGLAFLALFTLVVQTVPFAFGAPDPIRILAGPLAFAPFGFLWLISGGRWMGLGDAKLALALGWLLGLAGGYTAILIGFWTGALWSIALLTLRAISQHTSGASRLFQSVRHFTMKSEVPFAPFLIFGAFVVLFTHFNLFAILMSF